MRPKYVVAVVFSGVSVLSALSIVTAQQSTTRSSRIAALRAELARIAQLEDDVKFEEAYFRHFRREVGFAQTYIFGDRTVLTAGYALLVPRGESGWVLERSKPAERITIPDEHFLKVLTPQGVSSSSPLGAEVTETCVLVGDKERILIITFEPLTIGGIGIVRTPEQGAAQNP